MNNFAFGFFCSLILWHAAEGKSVITCGDNEHYEECSNPCPPETCSSVGILFSCLTVDPESCKPACRCNLKYRRDANGTCVPQQECQVCDDPNAYYSLTLATGCQDDCNNPMRSQICRPLRAQAGCVCKSGFVRNDKGLCLPYDQCNSTKCGLNERFEDCPVTCPPEDCSSIGRMHKCSVQSPQACTPGCVCRANYKRNAKGTCVPIQVCPPFECNGVNEEYNPCPPLCPRENCEFRKCFGRIGISLICQPACRCKSGYFRKTKGNSNRCVPENECLSNESNLQTTFGANWAWSD